MPNSTPADYSSFQEEILSALQTAQPPEDTARGSEQGFQPWVLESGK